MTSVYTSLKTRGANNPNMQRPKKIAMGKYNLNVRNIFNFVSASYFVSTLKPCSSQPSSV